MIREDWSTLKKLMFMTAAGSKTVEDTATGNPLTFITDKAKPLKSLLIPFTPQQEGSGDPSPQNIRSILPWNGLKVYGGGRNLFQTTAQSRTGSGVAFDVNADGTVSVSGTATGYVEFLLGESPIPNKGKIHVSGVSTATNIVWSILRIIDADGINLADFAGQAYRNDIVINLDNYPTAKTIRLAVKRANNAETSGVIMPMVQVGDYETAKPFEPYHPITDTDISFPSPVYGGEHEAVSGRLMDGWGIVDLGTFTYDIEPTADGHSFFVCYNAIPGAKKVGNNTLSSYLCGIYKTVKGTEIYFGLSGDYAISMVDSESPGIRIRDDRYETATELKTALTGVMLAYELATPQEIQLTPAQITALVGDNTIWSDADGSMTAVYLKKG